MSKISIIIGLLTILSVLAHVEARSLVNLLSLQPDDVQLHWKSFKENFSIKFQNKTHELKKKKLFTQRLKNINEHNLKYNRGEVTYQTSINEFTDKDVSDLKKYHLGAVKPKRLLSSNLFETSLKTLPDSVDWRDKNVVNPIRNQQMCGSCWAFSAITVLESAFAITNQNLLELSEQNLIDCTYESSRNGCEGGWHNEALNYVKTNAGVETQSSYPNKMYAETNDAFSHTCSYNQANMAQNVEVTSVVGLGQSDENTLTHAIAEVGPIAVVIRVYKSFFEYKSGVYNDPVCAGEAISNDPDLIGLHAVSLVGFGKDLDSGLDYYILRNSWDTTWGENGYMKIQRNGNNLCGIADYAYYPVVKSIFS